MYSKIYTNQLITNELIACSPTQWSTGFLYCNKREGMPETSLKSR